MNLKESKTYQNLLNALEGELKASAKYRIYESKAREDGYEQIGNVFAETAHNEQEHAEMWMKIIGKGEMSSTEHNLLEASEGEQQEWMNMYAEYADMARKEGFEDIAYLFEGVGRIERHHDFRYRKLTQNIQNGTIFCKDRVTLWVCLNCGNVYQGACAPKICPVCGYEQGYYQVDCECY